MRHTRHQTIRGTWVTPGTQGLKSDFQHEAVRVRETGCKTQDSGPLGTISLATQEEGNILFKLQRK